MRITRGHRYETLLWVFVASLLVEQAQAQVATDSGGSIFSTRPSERQLPLPQFEEPGQQPELQVPETPPPAPSGAQPYAIRVLVNEFVVTGNTVFTPEQIKEVVAPFEHREITNNELEEVRQKLTLLYINAGYVNSGAIIPDQQVVDNNIEIRIVEGRLENIVIEGTDRFKPDYFSSRLALEAGPPLNVRNLEQQLQILLQDPLVKSINAELSPGDRPGEAVLKATVAEQRPWDVGVVIDNKIPPGLGEARLLLQGEYRNLAGRGDVLSAELGLADGIDYDFKGRYTIPLTARDLKLGLYYQNGEAHVVEEPFDDLDIKTRLETYGIEISQPFFRTPSQALTLGALFERRRTNSSLLGEDFSFSPGVDNGSAVVSVIRLIQDWTSSSRDQVFSARSTISFGIDAFDSTINRGDLPDSQFVSWIPQLQWARRFGARGHQLSFRFDAQISNNPLLPIEKFVVGGLDSVRGYRTNQLVRDEGYSASLQYQLPVFENRSGPRNLQFAAFVDTGYAHNKDSPNPDPSYITGAGVGLIWDPSPRYHVEAYFAHAFDNVPDTKHHSLQDSGIYFRFIARPFGDL